MVAWGCAVWGTGYYYPPYVYYGGFYPAYYPHYPTYGYHASYNPWTGTYSRGVAAYGPYGGAGSFRTGFSLIGTTGNATITDNPAGTNLIGVDPLLGPLADNGGPTRTQLLPLGSPALDAGIANGLPSEQRGTQRTFDASNLANATGGDGTDIGATEQVAGGTCKGKAATVLFAPALEPTGAATPSGAGTWTRRGSWEGDLSLTEPATLSAGRTRVGEQVAR